MYVDGQFNYREIVVPITLVSTLEKSKAVMLNTQLNRWELAVPNQEIYDHYAKHFKPKREAQI
jgi:hypothetical protein